MVEFMQELRAKLQPAGYQIAQSVPSDDAVSYDLKALGALNDYIIPMVYDEHYQTSQPGPVASESWFKDQLDTLAKLLPPQKTVIGFGNYGYDLWRRHLRGRVQSCIGRLGRGSDESRPAI